MLKLHDFFFFKPCAQFKTTFLKIGPGVMTRRCVIERWVQRKNWPKTDFQWKLHTNRVFCFQDTLSLCFTLFIWFIWRRTCVSILWHTSLPKNATFAWKMAKNHDFGDFWWFSCFWHDVTYDVTVASYKVCLYFFWYQWIWEGHSYPLVPHTWCFVNRFPRSWGRNLPPQLWDGSKKPGSFRVKLAQYGMHGICLKQTDMWHDGMRK